MVGVGTRRTRGLVLVPVLGVGVVVGRFMPGIGGVGRLVVVLVGRGVVGFFWATGAGVRKARYFSS